MSRIELELVIHDDNGVWVLQLFDFFDGRTILKAREVAMGQSEQRQKDKTQSTGSVSQTTRDGMDE